MANLLHVLLACATLLSFSRVRAECVPCAPGTFCTGTTCTPCSPGNFCTGGGAQASRCMIPANCAVVGLSEEPACTWNVTTVAGNKNSSFADGQGTAASFQLPTGITTDLSGVVYVADNSNFRIRAVLPTGLVNVLAGNGTNAWSDGTGASVCFSNLRGVVIYPPGSGILYIADSGNHRIRKLMPSGVVTTFSGDGFGAGSTGRWVDGVGTRASFDAPNGIAVDFSGVLFIADSDNNRIRKITPLGLVTTLAGTGNTGGGYNTFLDGVGTLTATFYLPLGVTVSSNGIIYVADNRNKRIRRLLSNGTVSTFAGSDSYEWADGTGTTASFRNPRHLTITANGNLLVADGSLIRMITPLGLVSTLAGVGDYNNYVDGAASRLINPREIARLDSSYGISISSQGIIYFSDCGINRIRSLFCTLCPVSYYCSSGIPLLCPTGSYCPLGSSNPILCPAGTFGGTKGLSTAACSGPCNAAPGFYCPAGSSFPTFNLICPKGEFCLGGSAVNVSCSFENLCPFEGMSFQPNCLWRVTTLAGSEKTMPIVDGPGTLATFKYPSGVAANSSGVVYVADEGNKRIRSVQISGGLVTTFAGGGSGPKSDGVGTAARFYMPEKVALYPGSDILYVAESSSHIIRKISSTGLTSSFAGGYGSSPGTWIDGYNTSASFRYPLGLSVDSTGVVYVADSENNCIRKVSPKGLVSSLAGNGSDTFSDGMGRNATFAYPNGVAVDGRGYVYVADTNNRRIRLILPNGMVSTVAGNGSSIESDGMGTYASFRLPEHIAIAPNGILLVTDKSYGRSVIRMVTILGLVTTIAGGQSGFSDGYGLFSKFSFDISDITAGSLGTFYISDQSNHRIRELTCLACPKGYECSSGNPLPCDSGSLCPLSSFYRVDCPIGYFCPDTTYATICPAGSYCPLRSTSPLLCPAGSYSSVPGRGTCILCAPGLLAPQEGSTLCDSVCPIGTYRPRPGGTNISSCTQCPPGTFGEAEGATSCTFCPFGTAGGTKLGANSSTTCTLCLPGTFSASLSGAPACSPCPPGTFADTSGLSSCTPCPFNTYNPTSGAVSGASCLRCSQGSGTTSEGSSSAAACVSGIKYQCPVGTDAVAPSSQSDCAPLLCTPPLYINSLGTLCTGCGNGTFDGGPTYCTLCPPNALCPGLLATPLYNFSNFLPGSPAPSSQCPFLAPFQPPPPLSSTVSQSVIAAIVGGTLILLLLFATLSTTLYNRLSGIKLPPRLKPYVHFIDQLSASKPLSFGEDKLLAEREKSTLGASMTLLAVGALGVLAAVLATQRSTSNLLTQQSLSLLRASSVRGTLGWAWAQANAGDTAASALPAPASGIVLRFTASGEPGQCTPTGLATTGLSAGAWALLPPSRSCAGAPYPLSQFTLACPLCMFTASSTLSFTLPYSCQSILVEAGAVDADGSVATLALPPESTAAPGGGALLASVTWTLSPLFALLNNTLDPSACRRGWQLLSEGSQTTVQRLQGPAGTPSGGNLSLLPLASAVAVRVTLAQQSYVATTTVTELTSVLQLLSNIMGFQGIIFSVVGFVFGALASSRKHSMVKSQRNVLASSVAASSAAASVVAGKVALGTSSSFSLASLWQRITKGSTKLTSAPVAPQASVNEAIVTSNPLNFKDYKSGVNANETQRTFDIDEHQPESN